MDTKDIHKKKNLKKSQKILNHMNSEELAANLFRTTQADAKIKRDNIQGKNEANIAHYDVGQKVRKAIDSLDVTTKFFNKYENYFKKEKNKKI